MRTDRRAIWIGVFAFFWIIGILGGYYLYHKPFDSTFALALLRWTWNLFTALWITSVAGGIGRRIIRLPGRPDLERSFLQLCLGLGVASLFILLAGLFTPFLRIIIWAGSLLASVIFWRSIRDWWKDTLTFRLLVPETTASLRWIIGLVTGLILIASLTASAPPIQYDALTYHLALPRLYLEQNHIPALFGWVRSGMPQTGEMIHTWAMALASGNAAALTGWFFGVIALLVLVSFLKRVISPAAGWIGVAALLAGNSVASALGWAYIDWFCLAFGLAALLGWAHFRESGEPKELFLTGIFCGLAFATKYTGGIILAGLGILVLIRPGQKLKNLGWFLLGFLIPAIPWLVKNAVFTGNPLAPFSFSPGSDGQSFIQNLAPFGNLLDVFLLPVRATLIGIDGGVGYSHSIGPLLLLFGVFFWLFRDVDGKNPPLVKDVAIIGAGAILIWIVGNQVNGLLVQSRMYYAVFPVFALLACSGYEGLAHLEVPGIRVRRILDMVVILALGLTFIQSVRSAIQQDVLKSVLGVQNEEPYLDHNLSWYAPAMRTVREGGIPTLLIYEPRGYYCSPNCMPDEVLERWSSDFHRLGRCEAVVNSWRADGYEQILVNKSGVEFFLDGNDPNHKPSDLSALQECLTTLPVKQDYGGINTLYGIMD